MATVRLVLDLVITATLLGVGGAVACNDPTSSGVGDDVVIVSGGESGRLAILSGPDGRILSRPGPVPRFQDAHALKPDSEILYFVAFESMPSRALFALNTHSHALANPVTLAELEGRSQVPGLSLVGNYSLAFSPDGSRVLMADAVRGGETGVAVLDGRTLTPVGFVGPLSVRGIAATVPTLSAPAGRLFAIGTRTPGVFPRADSLFVLDGGTLAIIEIKDITPPAADGFGSLFAVQPSPSGEKVYLLGPDMIYAYDVILQQVTGSAPAPRRGSIAVSPDGTTVYVTDPGDRREFSGSGLILVFDASLVPRLPIDLRSESIDGVSPPTEGIALSRSGSHLYITSGTGSRGPLFGPQSRRVFIVEAASGELVRTVALGDYGAGPVFAVR